MSILEDYKVVNVFNDACKILIHKIIVRAFLLYLHIINVQ